MTERQPTLSGLFIRNRHLLTLTIVMILVAGASALISLPLRYMHTTVEMVHREDVANVIRLMYETLQNIKEGESFSYFE